MAGPANTVVALVPGSCHRSSQYDLLIEAMRTMPYDCFTIELSSVDSPDPLHASAAADTDAIRQSLLKLVEEEGKDVLLVTHSYSAVPGCGAAHHLSKVERRRNGLSGGILGLVAIAPILISKGETCLQHTGPTVSAWSTVNPSTGLVEMLKGPDEIYFNDLSPEQLAKAREAEASQAGMVFNTPGPDPAWAEVDFRGRLAFIRCQIDACLPVALVDSMREKTGVQWEIIDFDTGHFPMLRDPQGIAKCLDSLAKKYNEM